MVVVPVVVVPVVVPVVVAVVGVLVVVVLVVADRTAMAEILQVFFVLGVSDPIFAADTQSCNFLVCSYCHVRSILWVMLNHPHQMFD